MNRFLHLLLCLFLTACAAPAAPRPEAIGSYTNGCVADAEVLPPDGPGWQVMRLSRERYYGHPSLIAYLENLAKEIEAMDSVLLVGDMAEFKGGPMPYGHRSHQSGLDADLWFVAPEPAFHRSLNREERETFSAISLLIPQSHQLDETRWKPYYALMLKAAAKPEELERIFVHPAIKQKLCETYAGQCWLRKIRPWWGHDDHFHIRLACPSDSPDCEAQDAIPEGDGCGELAWWFEEGLVSPPPPPAEPAEKPELPKRCKALLAH